MPYAAYCQAQRPPPADGHTTALRVKQSGAAGTRFWHRSCGTVAERSSPRSIARGSKSAFTQRRWARHVGRPGRQPCGAVLARLWHRALRSSPPAPGHPWDPYPPDPSGRPEQEPLPGRRGGHDLLQAGPVFLVQRRGVRGDPASHLSHRHLPHCRRPHRRADRCCRVSQCLARRWATPACQRCPGPECGRKVCPGGPDDEWDTGAAPGGYSESSAGPGWAGACQRSLTRLTASACRPPGLRAGG